MRGEMGASVCASALKPYFSNDYSSKIPVDVGGVARSNTNAGR